MKRDLPKYVYPKGRKGYLYFTRAGQTTRMQEKPGTDAFALEYARLLNGELPLPTPEPLSGYEGIDFKRHKSKPKPKAPAELRRHIPKPIRREVWDRDGARCRYCGGRRGPFHLDHKQPWSRGGKHTPENLVVACQDCNRAKRDKTVEEWRATAHT